MHTLNELLEAGATRWPEHAAILATDGSVLTYRALQQGAQSLGAALRKRGARRNERVALVLPNGPGAAVGFLGVANAATAAPLNPAYSQEEFAYYLGDLQASALIVDAAAAPAAVAAATKLEIPVLSLDALREEAGSLSFVENNPAASDDIALVLHTSGTTSRPKIVPLTHGNLTHSAHNIARSLQLESGDRCLNIMPLFHVHGLIGAVLSSLTVGASVVCAPGFAAARFFSWMEAFAPTWYTAVPTMHQAIVAAAATNGAGEHRKRLRFIRSCSSALSPTLMAELEAAMGVPVVEAFGMTEASHQVVCNPLPPRARKPGSVGVSTGTEVTVLDAAEAGTAGVAIGEIAIKGACVTRGYASPPEANATAFTDGWFRTGDQGYIDAEGYVFITGRIKELINRGGEKISPREIDEALLAHPAVAQAVAFAAPHPTLGEDVAAAVVLRSGAAADAEEIRISTFQRLAAFKVPSMVVVVDAIPKGPTGKLQRIGLAEKLREKLNAAFVPPRDEIETVIADTWQEILGLPQVGIHDNFFAVGGDSLRAARVITRINGLFETELLLTSVFRHPTVERYAACVRTAASPPRLAAITATMRELQGLSDTEVQQQLLEEETRDR